MVAEGVRGYANLFSRAFLMVTLVSANSVLLAKLAHHFSWLTFAAALIDGGLISFVWFLNARSAGRTELPKYPAAMSYSLGAMAGTLAGMIIGGAF